MIQLDLFAAPAAPTPDRLALWRAIGAKVRDRGCGVSGSAVHVVAIAAPVVQCGRYVWALLEVEERGRRAWAHCRVHFTEAAAAERLDAECVDHIAASVDWSREHAEYLHECGVSQWLHSLTEPDMEAA